MTTQTHAPAAGANAALATPTIDAAALLRRLFYIDAVMGVPVALAFVLLPGQLEQALGLPSVLIIVAGAFLLAWAGVWFWVARTRPSSIVGAAILIVLNVLWVGHSVAIAAGAWVEPTAAGVAVVAGQALFPAALVLPELLAAIAIARHRRQFGA